MKTSTLFKCLFLFAITGVTACEAKMDNLPVEISPGSRSQTIEMEIDGIAFKFCLLNERGNPATVFHEGENIVFSFSLKNNLAKTISCNTDLINENFYRVYGSNGTDMGKAWQGVWCQYSLDERVIKIPPYERKQLNCPWLLSDNWHQIDYPLCKGESMNPLPSGEYSTTLHFDLFYTMDEQQKSIKDIHLKINFKIQ